MADVDLQIKQPQQVDNPFESEKYKNLNMTDQPLFVGSNMIEGMLNNDEVPSDIKTNYWWIFHKDNVLGFLDEERKQSKLLNFDIIKNDVFTTLRRKDYTFNTDVVYDVLRNVFETKLDRSVGADGGSNRINERKSLISQISENRQVNENSDSMVKEGFIKKLLNRK